MPEFMSPEFSAEFSVPGIHAGIHGIQNSPEFTEFTGIHPEFSVPGIQGKEIVLLLTREKKEEQGPNVRSIHR